MRCSSSKIKISGDTEGSLIKYYGHVFTVLLDRTFTLQTMSYFSDINTAARKINNDNANLFDGSFGELALLLLNTEVNIVMFGQRAYNVARQANSPALAAQKYVY
jgi:hypothetical protein